MPLWCHLDINILSFFQRKLVAVGKSWQEKVSTSEKYSKVKRFCPFIFDNLCQVVWGTVPSLVKSSGKRRLLGRPQRFKDERNVLVVWDLKGSVQLTCSLGGCIWMHLAHSNGDAWLSRCGTFHLWLCEKQRQGVCFLPVRSMFSSVGTLFDVDRDNWDRTLVEV